MCNEGKGRGFNTEGRERERIKKDVMYHFSWANTVTTNEELLSCLSGKVGGIHRG